MLSCFVILIQNVFVILISVFLTDGNEKGLTKATLFSKGPRLLRKKILLTPQVPLIPPAALLYICPTAWDISKASLCRLSHGLGQI